MNDRIDGVGIGLRSVHTAEILRERPAVPWLEILYDNFQAEGGAALRILERVRESYPIAFHCVGLDVGSVDEPDAEYLKRLREAVDRFEPGIVSCHLCWTAVDGNYLHDLLPLPYTREAVDHVAERIARYQEALGRRLLVENVSAYLRFEINEMSEATFLGEVARAADCRLLFDLNNACVNQHNLGEDLDHFLATLEPDRIGQMHLGGYEEQSDGLWLDTHGAPVSETVWDFFQTAVGRFPHAPVSIERDNNIPLLAELLGERERAERVREAVLASPGEPGEP